MNTVDFIDLINQIQAIDIVNASLNVANEAVSPNLFSQDFLSILQDNSINNTSVFNQYVYSESKDLSTFASKIYDDLYKKTEELLSKIRLNTQFAVTLGIGNDVIFETISGNADAKKMDFNLFEIYDNINSSHSGLNFTANNALMSYSSLNNHVKTNREPLEFIIDFVAGTIDQKEQNQMSPVDNFNNNAKIKFETENITSVSENSLSEDKIMEIWNKSFQKELELMCEGVYL